MHQHGRGTRISRNDLGTVSVSDGLASPLPYFFFPSSSVQYYYYLLLLLLLLLLLSPSPPSVNSMHIQVLYSATTRKPSKQQL